MKKSIQAWKTADGKIFTSEQQADRHADELLLHAMERLIKHCFTDANRPSVIKAVEKLHADKSLAKGLLSEVLYLFNYDSEEE